MVFLSFFKKLKEKKRNVDFFFKQVVQRGTRYKVSFLPQALSAPLPTGNHSYHFLVYYVFFLLHSLAPSSIHLIYAAKCWKLFQHWKMFQLVHIVPP